MTVQELKQLSHQHPIIIYDGQCFMCHRSIQFILRKDKDSLFRFARIQDNLSKAFMSDLGHVFEQDETVFLLNKGEYFTHSDVTIQVLKILGWPYRFLKIIPKTIRERVYKWVADNRYNWFGKSENCILLSKELQAKILL